MQKTLKRNVRETKMNIKISGLRSGLNYNDMLNPITGGFISNIEEKLGSKLTMSDIDDYECDLKLIFIQSGGSENAFLQNLDKLREPYYLLTNGSNNSLAASLEIMTYITGRGKNGEILHGDVDYIADRIRTLVMTEKLKKSLNETVFGVMGHPSDWLIASVPAYDEVTKKFGITFKDISLDEVKQEYDRAAMVNKDLLPGVFDDSEKVKALRVFGAFKTIAEKYGLSGFTVRCFDLLKPLATTGCAGLALLNDEGVTAACEGDIAALISMHIVRLLTGQPSFQANPSRITPADNTMVLTHCTIPLAMTGDIRLDTHFESGIGVAIKGYLREEDVTIFRLSADLKSFFVSDGKIIKNLDEPDLCRTQILVKFEEDVSEILKKPCGNHHIVFYGHHAEDIRRVMRSIL
jgi:L-fucose isomerase-like protein